MPLGSSVDDLPEALEFVVVLWLVLLWLVLLSALVQMLGLGSLH